MATLKNSTVSRFHNLTDEALADAIGRAKDESADALREAIQATKGFQGATGAITIDATVPTAVVADELLALAAAT